jgi:hypothetical protein
VESCRGDRPKPVVARAEEAAMRMTVRTVLGVLTAVLCAMLALGFAAGVAEAAPVPVQQQTVSQLTQVGGPVVAVVRPVDVGKFVRPAAGPAAPTTTANSTDYNKAQQQADSKLAKRKLVMAGVCVLLLVIVYIGHRAKYKHILRLKNLQNAKS